jgi:AraC-like DNA-binding protein
MKNLLYVFLVVAATAISCTNGNSNGNGNVADADSIYQWENVCKYYIEEPERALRMLDTAEIRGVMNMNEADERQEALSRDSLAQMLATNYNAVAAAIRECADGQTIGDCLDDWRIRHAAQLVATTNDPVGLIVEQSGFSSRSHFNTLFREKFKMTPSEYRNIAKEKNL